MTGQTTGQHDADDAKSEGLDFDLDQDTAETAAGAPLDAGEGDVAAAGDEFWLDHDEQDGARSLTTVPEDVSTADVQDALDDMIAQSAINQGMDSWYTASKAQYGMDLS